MSLAASQECQRSGPEEKVKDADYVNNQPSTEMMEALCFGVLAINFPNNAIFFLFAFSMVIYHSKCDEDGREVHRNSQSPQS